MTLIKLILFIKKMGHWRPLFLYFRLFNTVESKQYSIKTLPMSGFELRTSGVRSDHFANWATTTAPITLILIQLQFLRDAYFCFCLKTNTCLSLKLSCRITNQFLNDTVPNDAVNKGMDFSSYKNFYILNPNQSFFAQKDILRNF